LETLEKLPGGTREKLIESPKEGEMIWYTNTKVENANPFIFRPSKLSFINRDSANEDAASGTAGGRRGVPGDISST
jgi:hypothetical protein